MNTTSLHPKITEHNTWIQYLPWTLSITSSVLAIAVWANFLHWDFGAISTYQFFPVLGLLAFSIMWTHYMVGFLHRIVLKEHDFKNYYRITGYVVLAAICLHPGLLIFKRFQDGFGFPPHSYETYVAPGLGWITLLGSASLLVFLAYELHRFYENKSWWKYVVYAGDTAMVAIFYHGLRLGSTLQTGWFRYVWWFYGVTLIGTILYKYYVTLYRKEE